MIINFLLLVISCLQDFSQCSGWSQQWCSLLSYSLRVFHISTIWRAFTGVQVTASHLWSPGLLSVFWPISTMVFFIILLFASFFFFLERRSLVSFYWNLIDIKSLLVFKTILNILANLSNAVHWMDMILSPFYNSSSPFSKTLGTVRIAQTIIGITVTSSSTAFLVLCQSPGISLSFRAG